MPSLRRRRKLLVLGAVVVLVVVLAAFMALRGKPGVPAPPLPGFALCDLDGHRVTSDSVADSFVVLSQGMSW